MNVDVLAGQLCVEDLVPPLVRRRVAGSPTFLKDVARYVAMDDSGLYAAMKTCLRNLGRLESTDLGPDAELRLVLVPECWERLRPGSRDVLRRVTSSLAEYRGDQPSMFWRVLSSEALSSLRGSADALRLRIRSAADLSDRALIEQTRLMIAQSSAGDRWSPADPVYETGFTYRLVPAVTWRVLIRAKMRSDLGLEKTETPDAR